MVKSLLKKATWLDFIIFVKNNLLQRPFRSYELALDSWSCGEGINKNNLVIRECAKVKPSVLVMTLET